jgi:hypothetical protein
MQHNFESPNELFNHFVSKPYSKFDPNRVVIGKWVRVGEKESYIAEYVGDSIKIKIHDFSGDSSDKWGYVSHNARPNRLAPARRVIPSKPPKKPRTSSFEQASAAYASISDLTPTTAFNLPYLAKKHKSLELADLTDLGIKSGYYSYGKIYKGNVTNSIPVSILPFKNVDGEITTYQYFSSNKDLHKTNKSFCKNATKKGSFTSLGVSLKQATRQIFCEGLSTGLSAKNLKVISLNKESDCLAFSGDANNLLEIVKKNKKLLNNPFFLVDNDTVDFNESTSKNTGLLTAIQSLYFLGLENDKRLYIPISTKDKVDFNDLEHQENPQFVLCNAAEALARFAPYSDNNRSKLNKTLHLMQPIYVNEKKMKVKEFIKVFLANPDKFIDASIEINRGKRIEQYQLIQGEIDLILILKSVIDVPSDVPSDVPVSEFKIYFLPILQYYIKSSFKGISPLTPAISNVFGETRKNKIALDIQKHFEETKNNLLPKFTPTFLVSNDCLDNGKYIPKSHANFLVNYNTISMLPLCGAGKSVLISEFISIIRNRHKNIPILAISSLVSLVESGSQLFKLNSYKENAVDNSNQMITTLHSLYKRIDFFIEEFKKHGGLLIIDEFTHVLAAFNSGILSCNETKLFLKFKELIRTAKQVIIADAYLKYDAVALNLIKELRGENCFSYDIESVFNHGKKYYSVNEFNQLTRMMLEKLKNNQQVMFMTSSEEKGEVTTTLFKEIYPDKKGLFISSKTKMDNPDVQAFLKNPNKEIRKYDYIIFTPAINGGVSFDDLPETPNFHKFCYFSNIFMTPFDCMQMIGRLRRFTDITICFSNKFQFGKLQSEPVYLENYKMILNNLISHFKEKAVFQNIINVLEIAKNNQEFNNYEVFLFDFINQKMKFLENFQILFIELLEQNGYSFGGEIIDACLETKEALKESKELIINKDIDDQLNANKINDFEFAELSTKRDLNSKERIEKACFIREEIYGLETNPENVRYVIENKQLLVRTKVRSLVFFNSEKIALKTLSQLDCDGVNYSHKLKIKNYGFVAEFHNRLFDASGVAKVESGLEIVDNTPIDLNRFKPFLKWVEKHRHLIAVNIGKVRSDFKTSPQWIYSQLEFWGLSVDRKTGLLFFSDKKLSEIAVNYARYYQQKLNE